MANSRRRCWKGVVHSIVLFFILPFPMGLMHQAISAYSFQLSVLVPFSAFQRFSFFYNVCPLRPSTSAHEFVENLLDIYVSQYNNTPSSAAPAWGSPAAGVPGAALPVAVAVFQVACVTVL